MLVSVDKAPENGIPSGRSAVARVTLSRAGVLASGVPLPFCRWLGQGRQSAGGGWGFP